MNESSFYSPRKCAIDQVIKINVKMKFDAEGKNKKAKKWRGQI